MEKMSSTFLCPDVIQLIYVFASQRSVDIVQLQLVSSGFRNAFTEAFPDELIANVASKGSSLAVPATLNLVLHRGTSMLRNFKKGETFRDRWCDMLVKTSALNLTATGRKGGGEEEEEGEAPSCYCPIRSYQQDAEVLDQTNESYGIKHLGHSTEEVFSLMHHYKCLFHHLLQRRSEIMDAAGLPSTKGGASSGGSCEEVTNTSPTHGTLKTNAVLLPSNKELAATTSLSLAVASSEPVTEDKEFQEIFPDVEYRAPRRRGVEVRVHRGMDEFMSLRREAVECRKAHTALLEELRACTMLTGAAGKRKNLESELYQYGEDYAVWVDRFLEIVGLEFEVKNRCVKSYFWDTFIPAVEAFDIFSVYTLKYAQEDLKTWLLPPLSSSEEVVSGKSPHSYTCLQGDVLLNVSGSKVGKLIIEFMLAVKCCHLHIQKYNPSGAVFVFDHIRKEEIILKVKDQLEGLEEWTQWKFEHRARQRILTEEIHWRDLLTTEFDSFFEKFRRGPRPC